MIKRFMLFVAAMVVSISASAQFQEGKGYLGASLTGLDLHYNGQDGLNLGVQAKAGYFPWDNLMVLATFDAAHNGSEAVADQPFAVFQLAVNVGKMQGGLRMDKAAFDAAADFAGNRFDEKRHGRAFNPAEHQSEQQ